jgi:hypothetical protein
MDLSDAVVRDLAALSGALDEPGADLAQMIHQLGASCARAVTSYLGFSITLVVDEMPVVFAVLEDLRGPGGIVTSVMFPLSVKDGPGAASKVVLYAGTPGAFVDLAADLSYALGTGPEVQLDQHLTPPDLSPESTGLAAVSRYNQALGILLDRGFDEEQARAEMQRLAHRDAVSLDAVARKLLDSVSDSPLRDDS